MSNNKESNDDNKFSATTTINSNNNNNQAPLPNKKPDLQRFSVSKGKYSSNLNKQQQQQQEEANNNKNSLSKQSMSTVKLKDNKIVDKQFSADQQQSKSFQQKSTKISNNNNRMFNRDNNNYVDKSYNNYSMNYNNYYTSDDYGYQNEYYDDYYGHYGNPVTQRRMQNKNISTINSSITNGTKNKLNSNNKSSSSKNNIDERQLSSSLSEQTKHRDNKQNNNTRKIKEEFKNKKFDEITISSVSEIDNKQIEKKNNDESEKKSSNESLDMNLEQRIVTMTIENKRFTEKTVEKEKENNVNKPTITVNEEIKKNEGKINDVLEATTAEDVLKLSSNQHRGILFIDKKELITNQTGEDGNVNNSNKTAYHTTSDQTFSRYSIHDDNNNNTISAPKQYYNQNRKQQRPSQSQQSIRGLTNITRTLYDPNAPNPPPSTASSSIDNHPVIKSSSIQSFNNNNQQQRSKSTFQKMQFPTTVSNMDNEIQLIQPKPVQSPIMHHHQHPPPAHSAPPALASLKQMQEFYQHQFFNYENNEACIQAVQALQFRKQAYDYWISQAQGLEKSLSIYLKNSPYMEANFPRMMEAKTALQQAYVHAMITDIESSLTKNLDSQLWKCCFHNVIETFRDVAESDKQRLGCGNVKGMIQTIIDDGEKFFLAFIRQLESAFNLDTKSYFNTNVYRPEVANIYTKYALLCAQHCYLNLGDLSRYKENNKNGNDYSEARKYYLNSFLLYPKNGKSFKQLAILAVVTHRRLDAIYYYVRALSTTTLSDSVRQNLIQLFEEARRRLEMFEKELQIREKKNERKIRLGNQKLEIWKRTDGTVCGTSTDNNNLTNTDNIGNLNDSSNNDPVSQQELMRWFVLNYITVHGKLFTRTGMETYTEYCSKMLFQFQTLLRTDPCVFVKQQLVQIMAINMYQIEVNKQQMKVKPNVYVRSQYEESSLQLAMDMFGIMAEQTAVVLERHVHKTKSPSSSSPLLFNSWLKQVFPSLKIFTDWMTCHPSVWLPLPDQLPIEYGPHPDILTSLVKVINYVRQIDRSHIQLGTQIKDSVPVILEEDVELSGFFPLLTLPVDTLQTTADTLLDEAKDSKRIGRLSFFADYLCGLEPPVFSYDVRNKTYHSVLKSQIHSERSKSPSNLNNNISPQNLSGEQEKNNSMPSSPNILVPSSPDSVADNDGMNELKRKKRQLETQLAEKKKQEQVVKDILNTSRIIEIEVVPRFLVLDTNCFINYLPVIQKLIKQARFTIIIPLVVICELDKLSVTTNMDDDSYEHAEMVRKQANLAVKLIEECFESKEKRVQAMTGEGTIMDSIQFRNEIKKNESNDDTILGCCLKYCHDNPREFFPQNKDEAIRLHRDVVLVTDDRNLRLKAQARNVPVKDLNKFLQLAQITI